MEIREIVRQLRSGASERAVSQNMGIHRATVKRYRIWAEAQGYLVGELPPIEEMQSRLVATMPERQPPQNISQVEAYREVVTPMAQAGVRISAIYARLQEQGYAGSYSAVRRFVRQVLPHEPEVTVRMERSPGEEAQVDFGFAGYMQDEQGQLRKTWLFVMTLAWSRHCYVEFVFDQRVETWLALHRHAFEFFDGVPQRIVPDNLKAAVVKASWEGTDPQIQWAYRECAEHYGFLIAPCRPYTPQHKGKVERSVDYVRGHFLGGRPAGPLAQANREVRQWCLAVAGQRQHGTTKQKPWERFTQVEQAALQPLPRQAYEHARWKQVRLHRDCHIVFENAFYSAPFRYVGQPLLVRGSAQTVKVYTPDYQLIATHTRAQQAGVCQTLLDHLPPQKTEGLLWNAELALARAEAMGSAIAQTITVLLQDAIVDPLPKARRLLALADTYGTAELEAACARAIAHGDPAYLTVKRILKQGLQTLPTSEIFEWSSPAQTFARPVSELVGPALQEVSAWQ